MIVRNSGPLTDSLLLLSLGQSSHYALHAEGRALLFDPGTASHIPYLIERLERHGVSRTALSHVVLTHEHVERISGVPLLKRYVPGVRIVAPAPLAEFLEKRETLEQLYEADRKLAENMPHHPKFQLLSLNEYLAGWRVDRVVTESDALDIGPDLRVRAFRAAGHSATSFFYCIEPDEILVVDELFGFASEVGLALPAISTDFASAEATIQKIQSLELKGICRPWGGAIVGDLVSRLMVELIQNSRDLRSEYSSSVADGMPLDEIEAAVRQEFFLAVTDPCMNHAITRAWESLRERLRQNAA